MTADLAADRRVAVEHACAERRLAPGVPAKIDGAEPVAVPRLAGAPRPDVAGGLVPPAPEAAFAAASARAGAVFRIGLGPVASAAFSPPARR